MTKRMPAHIAGASAASRLRKGPIDFSRRPSRPAKRPGGFFIFCDTNIPDCGYYQELG